MNEQIYKLITRMVVAVMAGRHKVVQELYEQYLRERYLYVSLKELLESKKAG
ncbi:hypothetical protein KVG29_08760 [Caldicoprobacter algeriensis]|uniref:hypothetical protein n=1 Tax=Caldicoprobacter algeriensis TaxID=699281 RepID=UPI002079687C|nr:hypothetical protein [Caldicoprobacter algeriensis]MCM8901309.1 hypothetical protein [Caldicoprobacter algeriensis]